MSARLVVMCSIFACLLAVAFCPPASAELTDRGDLWAGGSGYMALDLVAPAANCRLIASTRGRSVTLSSFVPSQPRVAWLWRVPANARGATWRLTARCGGSSIAAVLQVHPARGLASDRARKSYSRRSRPRSILALARQIHVLQYGGAMPSSLQQQLGSLQTQAVDWWNRIGGVILSGFHTGPSAGQCTDYVSTHRPDVIRSVDIWAYIRFLRAHGGPLGVDWTAMAWAGNARAAGLPTGQVPEAGAVMVFQPGVYGAHSSGHVALVDSVHSDGSFTISEENAPVLGRISHRNFSAAAALAMMSNPHVTFIYK